MAKEFIVIGGTYSTNTYVILDGEACVFGLNNEMIGIMRNGCHFSNDTKHVFENKRLCHIVAKQITTVGIIERENLELLYEAYPEWKIKLTRLNELFQNSALASLQRYVDDIGKDKDNENDL